MRYSRLRISRSDFRFLIDGRRGGITKLEQHNLSLKVRTSSLCKSSGWRTTNKKLHTHQAFYIIV